MTKRIDTVAARSRLKVRRDPYFQRISVGVYVGYRKMLSGNAGAWSIRLRDEETGKQIQKSLGTLEQHPDFERFDKAVVEAKAMHEHAKAGGITTPKTVGDACEAYVKHVRSNKGDKAADDVKKRFSNYVLDDARFAQLDLIDLKPAHIVHWRERLADRPVRRGSGRGKNPSKQTSQKRTASSLNRDMTPFRAALNHAFENAWITSDFAWRSKLKPIKNADTRRNVYLDKEQRRALLNAATEGQSGIAAFVRVLCALPVRPGALAALKTRDFDARLNELTITLDKTGPRKIKLPGVIATIFSEASKSKLPAAPLFSRPDGTAWNKDAWKGPIKAAVLAAGLPEKTVMYSLRHSAITDLIVAGADLLTVSRMSGTSLKMIQEHYGHLQSAAAEAALAAAAI